MVDEIEYEQLLFLVGETDRELFEQGVDIRQRDMEVLSAVMRKLGHDSFIIAGVGTPKIVSRIQAIFGEIYRPQDLAIGGHIGVYMYRDIFARFSAPIVFGTARFNPFHFVELTPLQLRMIRAEPEQVETYLDQFHDVFDIQDGASRLNRKYRGIENVDDYVGLSRLHLHAAAAVVTGGYDYRGGVQGALLATELALKAGLLASGSSKKEAYGHDRLNLARSLSKSFPAMDAERIIRTVSAQPDYVANRYSGSQPKRTEVGHIVMGAQFVVSEIVRQLSDVNTRMGGALQARRYPA